MGKRTLLSFSPQIKVIDATLRDGGLVNNFYFEDDFVKKLYQMNIQAGVDYMEFGYKASSAIFDKSKFGKWKFCDEKDLRDIVGNNDTSLKIAVMADVGRTDVEKDILPKSESVIDMVRVASYINTIPAAVEMVENCAEKGYETTINIMAISHANESDLSEALELIGNSPANGVYLVDSYGSLYPEQIRRLADKYLNMAAKYGKYVGIHAHNNQQLAFANTIDAVACGVNYLDATVNSLGRGAGNCALELLLGFLKNPKYKLHAVLKFIEEEMLKLKENGLVWGYDIPYLISGVLDRHPSGAIDCIKKGRKDYADIYLELMGLE
ncbi:MAG: nucleoid-structuring protein H-NS [Clostridia bacterium]|jgi:4-hydroxy 2-oxovalerate aldolase|nr:nucleoid-structuring protein H-NS [Clostridia bacterium]MCI8944522.1 nucleoid-structuring protein H-NS [Clostridia bacterium]MCI9290382.1 nucleoid-structuring protein H-NS [Clostridia bacterium]